MSKYELLPQQLLHEGTITNENFFAPPPMDINRILAVHDLNYWIKLDQLNLTKQEIRRTGFPLSRQLIDREVTIMNGTKMCADFALGKWRGNEHCRRKRIMLLQIVARVFAC